MRARAVPVALDRLRVERRRDAEVFGDAVQQPARDPELVGDVERAQRADLELPLAGHHFGVDAGDAEAGVEARVEVRFDDVTAVHLVGADTAVVEALRRGEAAAFGEAVRPAVLEERVLLLDAEQRLVARVLLGDRREQRARVRRVRRHVGQQHLAHDEDVVAAADRVRAREHRLQARSPSCCPAPGSCSTRRSPRSEALRRPRGPSSSSAAGPWAPSRRSRCTPPCRPLRILPAAIETMIPVVLGQCSGPGFPGRCPIVNALLPPPPGLRKPRAPSVHCPYGAPARIRPAHGRGAGRPLRPALVHRRPRLLEVGRDHPGRARSRPRRGHDLRRVDDRGLQPDPGIRHARQARRQHVRAPPRRRRRRRRRPDVLRHRARSPASRSTATRATS